MLRWRTAVLLCGLVGLPGVAVGELLFDGPEFQVNTYTTSPQAYAAVATSTDGGFVVVWTSDVSGGTDNSVGIHAKRYDSNGVALGTEFQVNSYVTGIQKGPAVATSDAGGFVVVWHGYFSSSVQAQRYDSSGAALGTEFQVDSLVGGYRAAVTARSDGGFVVAWAGGGDIQAQRYDSSGAALGTEFQVNTYTTRSQTGPAVATTSDDGIIVVWSSDGSSGTDVGEYSIQAQRYGSSGATVGTEFQVNTYTTGFQTEPAVATFTNGDFLVAWQGSGSGGTDTSSNSVHAQRYDSSGTALGTEFQVNSYTTDPQNRPKVATSGDGSFIVVWESVGSSGADVSNFSVQAQRYDSTGAVLGTEFQVNTFTLNGQRKPRVAASGDGGFVIVWWSRNQDGSMYGIFGQRLCEDSNPNCPTTTTTSSTTTSTTTTTVPFSLACASVPVGGCLNAAKASFLVKDKGGADKDQLKWKLSKVGSFAQAHLGDPAATTNYTVCIYDETATTPALVGSLTIAPNAGWDDKDPKGFKYKDKTGVEDGVTGGQLKTSDSDKGRVQIKAKGSTISWPIPFDMAEYFDQDTDVTVQLVNSTTATCWTSEFQTNTKNTAELFKAKAP